MHFRHLRNAMPEQERVPLAIRLRLMLSGWRANRRVDTRPFRTVLERAGIQLFPAAESFLQNFGLLSVNFFEFNPMRIFETYGPDLKESLAFIEEEAGFALCPVGIGVVNQLILMDEKGRFFISENNELWGLGRSAVEAVEALYGTRSVQSVEDLASQ